MEVDPPTQEHHGPAGHDERSSTPCTPPNQVGLMTLRSPPPVRKRSLRTTASGGDGPIVLLPEDKDGPVRDSPNNPFLLHSDAAHFPRLDLNAPSEFDEPSYVFRGRRLNSLPPEVREQYELPPGHPDLSPSPFIRPAEELSKRGQKRKRTSTPSPSPPSPPSEPTRKAKGNKKQRTVATTAL